MGNDPTDMRARLRKTMAVRGFSARELARRAGLKSETQIGAMLRGLQESFRAETLERIAEALGVRASWLLTGEGERDAGSQNFALAAETFRKRLTEVNAGPSAPRLFEVVINLARELGGPGSPVKPESVSDWVRLMATITSEVIETGWVQDAQLLQRWVTDHGGDTALAAESLNIGQQELERALASGKLDPPAMNVVRAQLQETDEIEALTYLRLQAERSLQALAAQDAEATSRAVKLATDVISYASERLSSKYAARFDSIADRVNRKMSEPE